MANEFIIYEKDKESGAAIITFNRPELLNAWRGLMKMEIANAFDEACADPEVVGIIFTGAGRGFGAGGDQRFTSGERADLPDRPGQWFPDDDGRADLGLSHDTRRLIQRLLLIDKPSIAAINGVIAGSHISVACACDIRIASDQARFRLAFTRIGDILSVGSSYWLPKLIGIGHTLELAYTNDFIDGKEMERIGLVNRVVPHDELIPYCKEMIKKMKQIPPGALFQAKRLVRMNIGLMPEDLEQVYMNEGGVRQWIPVPREEREEGRKSLWEKRDPVYKGRGIKTNIRW